MNSNRPELTPEEKKELFLLCFAKEHGHITNACRLVGVHRKTFYYWIKDDPEFAQMVEDIDGEDTDGIIEILKRLAIGEERTLEDGKIIYIPPSLSAVKYYLDNKGKSGGFGRRVKEPPLTLPQNDEFHLHLHGTPEPENLADWEQQVREARQKRLEAKKEEEDGD